VDDTPKEQRRQELLGGKRSWNVHDDAYGNTEIFYSDFILPLKLLKYAGVFERLEEHEGDNGNRIDRIDVVGEVLKATGFNLQSWPGPL
jgi:hypothetical protein